MKTRFSFEVQRPAPSEAAAASAAPSDEVMDKLQVLLQQALAAKDANATVTVSDSHKGGDNQLVELVSSLQDADIESILAGFASQHGLRISALE